MSPEGSIRKFTIKVLGIGGAGCNVARHFASLNLPDVPCVFLNTDAAALARAAIRNAAVRQPKRTVIRFGHSVKAPI